MRRDDESSGVVFRDRREAGRQLAARLQHYRDRPRTVVLGLPRGGVVPAAEVAATLRLPLDVIISRKIGAPGNPELAIGAIAEGGDAYMNEESAALTAASPGYVTQETSYQRAEIARRQGLFRNGRALSLPDNATVILVDDGVATGSTVIAAIRALRQRRLARLILAIPVAPPDTVRILRDMVDELVVLSTPMMFWAVGAFYEEFQQVSDDEVCRILRTVAEQQSQKGGPAARQT
jgi:putative phosphoribosyl transferase